MKLLAAFASLALLASLPIGPAFPQGTGGAAVSPRQTENEIAALINDYRRRSGLPPIARSPAMDRVARAHVEDLAANHPDQGVDSRGLPCNAHSWSAHGRWRAVCYTADHFYAAAMWSKPSEITGGAYSAQGFEIAMWTSGAAISAESALAGWQRSSAHNAVIIEQERWAGARWQAMGVGVGPGYAVVWFGKVPDGSGR
ncbi:MAG: hypothetical protein QOG13_502 [Sphingomonadales bacterium]|jgi:uncharacterized protein YkwD|nr:hypothetical protein [Sphingomonadales bacterium]